MARKKPERTDDNLDKLIQDYYNLDSQIKELKDKKDPLNKTIKLAMRNRGINTYRTAELVANCTTQIRTKYFDELAIKALRKLGLHQAIKEVVDADAVKELVKTSQITEDLLANFVEVKEIELLTIKRE